VTPCEHESLRTLADNWLSDCESPWTSYRSDMNRLRDRLLAWLSEHPPEPAVPVTELLIYRSECGGVDTRLDALIAKHSIKPALPPNPHQQGTYLWAREEHMRGRAVRCPSRRLHVAIPAADDWDASLWTYDEFIATDWEVAT